MNLRNLFSLPLFRHRNANLKDRFKLVLGALVFPAQTFRWRAFVADDPSVSKMARRYPRVLHKIYRPYLSRHLCCADRVDLMIAHYMHLARFGLSALVTRAAARPVKLATFEGKHGAPFELRLSAANVGHREGELTLQLFADKTFVYAVSFTLCAAGGLAWIQLGALQGMRGDDGAHTIKDVTKALHGYRPKQWMVALVRDLGEYFGCSTLRMVSNRNRVTINWRRGRRIASDYDAMWHELRAERRADGDYELPCAAAGSEIPADVASNKRAQARRRVLLLANVCLQLRAGFDSHVRTRMHSFGRLPSAAPAPSEIEMRAAA